MECISQPPQQYARLPNPHCSVALTFLPLRGGVYFASLGSQLACDSFNNRTRQR